MMRLIFASVLLSGSISSVWAVPVFYTDSSVFQGNFTGTLTTETFDTHPGSTDLLATPSSANGITVSSDRGGVTPSAPPRDVAALKNAFFWGSGQSIQFFAVQGSTSITFNFATAINAFGINHWDLGNVGQTDLSLTTDTGSAILFDDFATPGGAFGFPGFAGVIDTMSTFTSVTINNTLAGDFLEMDNLMFGTLSDSGGGDDGGGNDDGGSGSVPVPGTLLLVLLGSIGLGFTQKKRGL